MTDRPTRATPRAPRSAVDRAVSAVLTHPLAMRIKQPARDLWWTVAGAGLKNPALPDDVRSILFVCLGNICRSPFAALLADRRLADAGETRIRCASAGLRTTQGHASPQEAQEAAAGFGLSLSDHRPQTLTYELVAASDLIVVMEAAQFRHLQMSYPDHAGRVLLLSLYDERATGAFERYHIADPFSRPRAAFEYCYRRIDRAVSSLLVAVESGRPAGQPDVGISAPAAARSA